MESSAALDELKLSRACCRRMLATHVDVVKYQLLYPTYEDGIQRLGTTHLLDVEDTEMEVDSNFPESLDEEDDFVDVKLVD